MPTPTTTYSLSKPTVGGDDNAWGTEINNNLDKLDDLLDGTLSITPNLATGWEVGGVAVTSTAAELNFVDGVTSNIQTQLNAKQATITGAATTVDTENLTASRALVSDASGKIAVSLVTATELGYVDGVTSAIQTQLNAKQPLDAELTVIAALTPTDGNFIVGNGSTWVTESGNTVLTSLGVTATATELNFVDGVTSAIQTQLNGKQATITGAATTIDTENLTVSRALVSDASGKIAVSAVTSTELGYLDGVTSNIQTQLDAKAANTTQVQATWEAGTGTTETIVSPAKVKAAIDALVPQGIGVGQTWQNVTASRTTGTAYQNTTGRPIMVAITRDSAGAESLEISTDGVSWNTILSTPGQGADTARFQLIIPDQLYYRYNGGAAGTTDWWELR
jgi:fructose-specific component phosphotransferase system IIB-like protein